VPNPLRVSIALLCAALLAGCAALAFVNDSAPTDTYRRTAGVAYGPLDRQRLDVYVPASRPAAAPVVVFFYGGAWRTGSRSEYLFVGEALASRGIVAVVADYRLYPEVRFPDFVSDSALAMRWALANAAAYGGDPRRVFAMGHSAGAYNAAMVALDPEWLARAGGEAGGIRGFIGLAGPYDFLPLKSRSLRDIFGYPDTPPETQPIRAASAGAPPTLLVTARSDGVVDPGNSVRLAAKLRESGVAVTEVVYDSVGHRTLVGAFAVPLRGLAPVLDDVERFVREQGG
jgi:acetyl esterase/lipase